MTALPYAAPLTRRRVLAGMAALSVSGLSACGGGAATGPVGGRTVPAALLVPKAGSAAAIGQSIENASTLAVPGLRPRVYDTGDSAEQAAAAAKQAITDGAGIILGPLRSEQAKAVALAAGTVPVVTFSNDDTVAGGNLFVMGVTPLQSVATVLTFAKAQGLVRVAVLGSDSAIGRATGAAAERVARAGGLKLAAIVLRAAPAGGLVSALRDASGGVLPDAVILPDTGAAVQGYARGLRDSGVQVLGTVQWGNAAGVDNPDLDGAWFAGAPPAVFDPFAARYETAFDAAPGVIAALGHDAVAMVSQLPKGPRNLRDALMTERGFSGVLGRFYFDADGHCRRDLSVLSFRQGRLLSLGEVAGT